ncbi:MAG: hypothetical protein NXY59_00785 [Aigarchaeota archaeon]|nr:hypothetical protein [Candidatus Pelearchaeum maunauluense]
MSEQDMPEEKVKQDIARDTLHIATFGEEDKDAILVGIRYLPITKLILVTVESERENAHIFAGQLATALKIATEVHVIEKPLLYNTIMRFRKIVEENKGRFDEIIVNASSGDKQLGCAALTASFINGLKTIAIDGNHPVLLPIIRLSYNEIISEAKMNILKALGAP